MIAEILSTGDEIRSGAVIDSNSAYIAQKLEDSGIPVSRHNCTGDDIYSLVSVLTDIGKRADIAVVTGGLGPTADDRTAEAAGKAGNVQIELNNGALNSIKAFFKTRNRSMRDSDNKQAMLPKNSECIYNLAGTAPGFAMKIGNARFFFLPGVPSEMYKMFSDSVLPQIQKLQGKDKFYCITKTISSFGLTEAATGEMLSDLTGLFPDIKLGLRAIFPEIHVKLYANGKNKKKIDLDLANATRAILQKIGEKVFSTDESSMEAVIGNLLQRSKTTVAVAESCTGGLIAHRLTNISGSSDYFLFSGVTYSNKAKETVLGVSSAILKQYGAVHEKTAKEMAERARRIAKATYGIATSGIAGPAGGTKDKPVGTVCIGIATPETSKSYRYHFPFSERLKNKTIFATTALDLLRRTILNIEQKIIF